MRSTPPLPQVQVKEEKQELEQALAAELAAQRKKRIAQLVLSTMHEFKRMENAIRWTPSWTC